jgi:hypothetical protein
VVGSIASSVVFLQLLLLDCSPLVVISCMCTVLCNSVRANPTYSHFYRILTYFNLQISSCRNLPRHVGCRGCFACQKAKDSSLWVLGRTGTCTFVIGGC